MKNIDATLNLIGSKSGDVEHLITRWTLSRNLGLGTSLDTLH